ncbi:MAG: pilin [bacterium]
MKKLKKIFIAIVLSIVSFPFLSFAQTTTITNACSAKINNIGDIICKFSEILNRIIPVMVALGIVYFVWGVVQYMIKDEEEAKKKGKDKIIYGIIGLVVIVGMWGLVKIVVETFNLSQTMTFVNPANVLSPSQSSVSGNCFAVYQGVGAKKIGDILSYATCLIGSSVIPLLFVLAVASFVWGVIQYVINSNEESKRAKGRDFMIWGIIALVVMVSIWGLVGILRNTFGIENFIPQVKSR